MAQKSAPNSQRRIGWWIKAFVAFHIFAITVWALPPPPDAVLQHKVSPTGSNILLNFNNRQFKSSMIIRSYLLITGAWQYWDMFAPNPSNTDVYGTAVVIYKNGAVKFYQYPRIYLLPLWEKYPKERFRKFFERVHDDNYSYLWPAFAQRIALLCDNPSNPPRTVELFRYWKTVSPPGKPQPKRYSSYCFFKWAVDENWLARARKEGI